MNGETLLKFTWDYWMFPCSHKIIHKKWILGFLSCGHKEIYNIFEQGFTIHINPWNNLQKHLYRHTDLKLAFIFISSLYGTIGWPKHAKFNSRYYSSIENPPGITLLTFFEHVGIHLRKWVIEAFLFGGFSTELSIFSRWTTNFTKNGYLSDNSKPNYIHFFGKTKLRNHYKKGIYNGQSSFLWWFFLF